MWYKLLHFFTYFQSANKTELGIFCGTSTPRFESTGPNMTVVFTTDGTNEAQGFLLKYKQKSGMSRFHGFTIKSHL